MKKHHAINHKQAFAFNDKIFSAKRIVRQTVAHIGIVLILLLGISTANAQVTVRYQNNIQGGATLFGNSWFNVPVYDRPAPTYALTILKPDVDSDPTTAWSTSADLILPAGSTILKAYLSIEKGLRTGGATAFTSAKILLPGATSYTNLFTPVTYVVSSKSLQGGNPVGSYEQTIFDITSIMPAKGFSTSPTGGAEGRYFLADPTPAPIDYGGWSIIVVYTNPLSKFRSVTVADNWAIFQNTIVNSDITGVKVPASGTVKAVVGVTGTYGDRNDSLYNLKVTGTPNPITDYVDELRFGLVGGGLTKLADPMTGSTLNVLNSSIAMTSVNNVSADGGPAMSGNVTTRNPVSKFHFYGPAESYEYDADVYNASGIIPPSATPVNVRLQQAGASLIDILASGSYFISVDLATAPSLTKTVSPTTISDGGVATYTWVITNTTADAITQSGLGFTDELPSSIRVAAAPGASIVGGTGGVVTAVPGSNVVSVSGLTLAAGQTATITVKITNVAGQLNASCAGVPSAFTNSAANITGTGILNTSGVTPQCITVTTACAAAAGTLQ